jgi:hypothetical protein
MRRKHSLPAPGCNALAFVKRLMSPVILLKSMFLILVIGCYYPCLGPARLRRYAALFKITGLALTYIAGHWLLVNLSKLR